MTRIQDRVQGRASYQPQMNWVTFPMKTPMLLSPVLAASIAIVAVAPPAVADSVNIGVLSCEAVEGTRMNLLIRSTVDVVCTFDRDGHKESYRGETGIEFGLDLSFRKNERFAFTVISTSNAPTGEHALAGKYVGVKATATVIVGLGAAALVGGSNKSFGLQPLALEANQGFGLSGGIGFLYIEAQP